MNVLNSILDVFDSISTWLGDAISAVIPIFWNSTDGLTFVGTLAVCGLAFSVIFLIIGIIQRFLHFAG